MVPHQSKSEIINFSPTIILEYHIGHQLSKLYNFADIIQDAKAA